MDMISFVFGAAMAAFGWFMRALWESNKGLRKYYSSKVDIERGNDNWI